MPYFKVLAQYFPGVAWENKRFILNSWPLGQESNLSSRYKGLVTTVAVAFFSHDTERTQLTYSQLDFMDTKTG
jgi:hypothetical protein